MQRIKVLFVCIHNSARSQMAEAFLNAFGEGRFEAQSAGLEPGMLNPMVVEVMKEIGFDIGANRTKSVSEFFKSGMLFNYVITVCDESSAEKCPVFPGHVKRLHWSFPDPSALQGEPEEIKQKVRIVRDKIKRKVQEWIEEGT
jgi:arsenate reductase